MSAESTTGYTTEYDIEAAHRALLDEGITACRGAFSRDWVAQLRDDVDAAFEEARGREGGAVGRGPQRWYVEVHPQAFRGFVDLVDHPLGQGRLRGGAGAGLRGRGTGLRRAVSRSEAATVAPRLPQPSRDPGGAPADVAGVQHHHGRHDRRDGPLRDRTRDAVGPRRGLRPRDVPAAVALSRVRVTRGPQVPQGRRHLGSLGAHPSPRYRQPVVGEPPLRRARCRRPGRRQPRAPRPGRHA